jgi:hypothetical protein
VPENTRSSASSKGRVGFAPPALRATGCQRVGELPGQGSQMAGALLPADLVPAILIQTSLRLTRREPGP